MDGIVRPGAAITGGTIALDYDPSKITVVEVRSGSPNWSISGPGLNVLAGGSIRIALHRLGDGGQTQTAPLLYVRVRVADATVALDDCITMRLDQDNSRLLDQTGNMVIPSAPCDGQILSTWDAKNGPRPHSAIKTGQLYGTSPMGSVACPIDVPMVTRVLRVAGGLEAVTTDDISLLDYSRNGIIDIPDVIDILRNPCARLVDVHPFTNGLDASPAVFDMDGDGLPEVTLAVVQLDYNEFQTPEPLTDPNNDNQAYVYEWAGGGLQLQAGWPRWMRDASTGLSVGHLDGAPRVVAEVSQDEYADAFRPTEWSQSYPNVSYFASRLSVWAADGTPVSPWFPQVTNTDTGMVPGHAYAAPVLYDLFGTGRSQIIQAGQGRFADWDNNRDCPRNGVTCYYKYGAVKIWSDTGQLLAQTQHTAPSQPWYATDDKTNSSFALNVPPVVAHFGTSGDCVVSATEDGRLYAWDRNGNAVPGWFPSIGAVTQTETIPGTSNRAFVTVYNSLTAVDFDGTGDHDTLVCTGDYRGPYNHRRLYRFRPSGGSPHRAWPPSGLGPGLSSGIAVGRIRRLLPSQKCIVVGDTQGYVRAFDPDLTLLWTAPTTHGMPIIAQPVIGDVNNDGLQDVVVGGTDGFVYAFDGDTGALIWRIPTLNSALPVGNLRDAVQSAPALAKLASDGRLYVIVLAYNRDCVSVAGSCSAGGHMMVIDCGPTNTNGTSRYDWPQYQHDAQRTGRAVADM